MLTLNLDAQARTEQAAGAKLTLARRAGSLLVVVPELTMHRAVAFEY